MPISAAQPSSRSIVLGSKVSACHISSWLIEFDGMKFIPKAHQIFANDSVIEMRQKEAQVLEYFIRNTGKIISCDEIIENIWDDENIPAHATIRTYIKNLRKMFEKEYFENIKGEGYRFNIV